MFFEPVKAIEDDRNQGGACVTYTVCDTPRCMTLHEVRHCILHCHGCHGPNQINCYTLPHLLPFFAHLITI